MKNHNLNVLLSDELIEDVTGGGWQEVIGTLQIFVYQIKLAQSRQTEIRDQVYAAAKATGEFQMLRSSPWTQGKVLCFEIMQRDTWSEEEADELRRLASENIKHSHYPGHPEAVGPFMALGRSTKAERQQLKVRIKSLQDGLKSTLTQSPEGQTLLQLSEYIHNSLHSDT